ncbi:MAG TPA: phosphatidylglycerophosphatase A [Gammaproteobacteria bacterium]|nr:phosphatidylglycerophosphatase A [Gammaproteobacteria bacterium]
MNSPHVPEILRSPVHLLAFGFGAGLAPRAPGTFGTLVAVPIAWALAYLSTGWHAAIIVALFVAGIGICGASARRLGVHDFSGIVFDEMVGYLITLIIATALAPFNWPALAAGFVLFRFFDILKPWPIGWLDRRIGGGTGIMLDDAVAGLYAGGIWLGITQWIPLIH